MQFELPWALGPADGRYVVRGHAGEPEHVLVLATLGAPVRVGLRRRRRRARDAEPEPEVATAPVTRATVVAARPFSGEDAAQAWLDGADLDAEADAAIAVLNDVLHVQRVVRADPYVREVAREQALVTRVGVGQGDEVAEGRWTRAAVVPPVAGRSERRVRALRPQERFAAILGGRDVALAAEELTLRARLDLDRGRTREAALQLRVALEAAIAELQAWAHVGDLGERLAGLREARGAVGAAANRALEGGLEPQQIADVERVVERVEAALAARVAQGLE